MRYACEPYGRPVLWYRQDDFIASLDTLKLSLEPHTKDDPSHSLYLRCVSQLSVLRGLISLESTAPMCSRKRILDSRNQINHGSLSRI